MCMYLTGNICDLDKEYCDIIKERRHYCLKKLNWKNHAEISGHL